MKIDEKIYRFGVVKIDEKCMYNFKSSENDFKISQIFIPKFKSGTYTTARINLKVVYIPTLCAFQDK